MTTFALLDVVSPYVLGGAAIGQPWHELLSALFVTEVETSFDDNGVTVSGIARFSAELDPNQPLFTYTPPASISFAGGGTASVHHRTARTDGAFWDFPDIAIAFRLSAPRISSPVADLVLSGGAGGTPPPLANAAVGAVLTSLGQGQPSVGQPAADAPDTVFHLDLLIDAATLHLPFLTGAFLQPDGMLAPDSDHPEVKVTLPKIKLSLAHSAGAAGGATDPQLVFGFDSWAAHDIDDPAGSGYGELIRMDPPYALFGPDAVLGFGFASVILDLSATSTPPDLLAKFGVGDDFRGIYLPDVRVFVKPPGLDGLGIDVSARELLIGLGPEGGVSGIFGLDIVKPDAPQSVVISIYDEFGGHVYTIRLPDVADPTQPAQLHATEVVPVPLKTQWVVDVSGGQPPYNITVDGTVQTTDPVVITLLPGSGVRDIPVNVTDVHAGGQSRPCLVRVTPKGSSLSAPPGGILATSLAATITPIAAPPAGFAITMVDAPATESVIIEFAPPGVMTATVTKGGATTPLAVAGGRVTLHVKHGEGVDVAAAWTTPATPAATPLDITGQFQYDQPRKVENKAPQDPEDPSWTAFAGDPTKIRTIPSKDAADPNGGWVGEDQFLVDSPALAAFVAQASTDPTVEIDIFGSASKEHVPLPAYNSALSARRIWAMREVLESRGVTNPIKEHPEGERPPGPGGYLAEGRGTYRSAIARIQTGGSPGGVTNGSVRITRPPRPPVPEKKKPPVVKREPAGNDDLRFKELHLRVQIDHNRLIAVEFRLKLDVETALERYLARVKQENPGDVGPDGQGSTKLPIGKRADPNDGVLDIRIQLTLDDTVGRWQVLASLFETDPDGFLQTPRPTTVAAGTASENYWRDFFGTMIAIAPLVDASGSSNTPAGDLAALTIAAGIPLAAVALDIVHVPRITLYGGELTVGHDPTGTRGALLLDVEVALIIDLEIGGVVLIDTDPRNPITVRYKAVGFATSDEPQIRDLVPVFDSSKGYTINIPSSGGIRVPDPLGDIIQVAGTRIARSNPANIELDLELKADLGVVSVDKTTVRIPLEGGFAPTISALGVHLNVPGAIEGSGYVAIFPDGFAGQIDVSLSSLGVRVAAGLSVRHVKDPADPVRTATAVLVTLEIDFPVPIALGSSGLGIYGFGGLFALHHRRTELETDPVPALDWLERVGGNPLDITGWTADIDHWAIGLGAVLGTMDAGFVMNVKGMVIFEMPGPRILMVMKAKVLWIRPPRAGNPTATILAIIDVDLGRGRITIGITFDYGIAPLLNIHVPVRAIFPFDDLPHFAIDAGTWYSPAKVTFFEIFSARGYFMVRGKGIPDVAGPGSYDAGQTSPLPYPLTGFSIATGVSVSFIWGSRPSGLYLSVGASVDIGLGFSPIMFTGVLRIWGELHLWIVSIEATAQLTVTAGQVPDGPPVHDPEYPGDPTRMIQPTKNLVLIDGEVHGEVDFFFFTISGSVHVTLGDQPASPPEPPPLITGVSLQSRAAALLSGVSSDRPIDGRLADAHGDASAISDSEAVPIDSIIVVHLDCTPRVTGAAFATTQPAGNVSTAIGVPVGPAAPAVHRGEPFYTYQLKKVTLDQGLTDGAAPVVWWPNQPKPTAETKRELALLTRVPDPHPSAVEHSKHAEDLLIQHWKDTCAQIAPPTSVLWTFHDTPLGPSAIGWILFGSAWPDPPGSTRQSPPDLRLDIAETWRSGNPAADLALDIAPARVLGAAVRCSERCGPIRDPRRVPRRGDVLRDAPLAGGVMRRSMRAEGIGLASPATAVLDTVREAVPMVSSVAQLASLVGVPASVDRGHASAARRWSSSCWARALEAPFVRFTDLDLLRGHPLGNLLADLLQEARDRAQDELQDVVALRTDRIVSARFLLFVPELVVGSGAMRMRCYGADGSLLDESVIDGSGDPSVRVLDRTDLPGQWIDPDGPWHCRVDEVWELFQRARQGRERGGEIILVDAKVPDGTTYVHLGLTEVERLVGQGLGRPSYLVGVVETLTAAEVERHHVESEMQLHLQSELNGALTAAPDPPALLLPDKEYGLTVEWQFATCKEDGSDVGTWQDRSQTFRFRTDDQPLRPRTIEPPGGQPQTMPVRLDPWVLTTDPDEGDRFYFHGESIKVVFSVDYLLTMWEAYGVPLQAKVRSASYKHSDPASPTFGQTFVPLTPTVVTPLIGSAVLSPWEGMIRGILAELPMTCIDASGDVTRHTILDVNLLLAARTDYILDIEPVNPPATPAGEAARPLFRRSFATSRYASLDEMCADVAAATLTEIPAGDLTGILALGSAPRPMSAAALDAALAAAGLRPVVGVPGPEIEVVWDEVGGVWQPRVLVIRTPEPLVRTRKEPAAYEPPGQPRLQREVISLVDRPFLEVVQTPGVAGAPTMQIVSEPGLDAVIVLIEAGRDAPISLSVRRHANQLLGEGSGSTIVGLVAMTLDAATWEVAD